MNIDPNSAEFRRKHRQTDFIDKDLELTLVAGVIKSRELLEKVYSNLDSNIISSDNIKWIYDKVIELYVQDSVLMDTEAFENILDVNHAKRKVLMVLWKKVLKRSKVVTSAAVIGAVQKLKKYYDGRNISLCISEMISDLSKAKQNGDLGAIVRARDKLTFFSDYTERKEIKVDCGDPRDGYKRWKQHFRKIQKNPDLIGGVPTGVEDIDKQLLGIRNGEFGLVSGPTGSGKSILLMNMLTYCWKTVGDIAAITIEMPRDQYQTRWYCEMSGINYEKFRKYELSAEQWNHLDEVVERSKKNQFKFIIVDMPEGCTASAVRSELKTLTAKNKIRLVGIDYMNIMSGKSGSIDFSWQNQVEIAVNIKLNIARGLFLPTWSVAQVGKDDLAFGTHIKDQLDVGLRIVPDENSAETGIVQMEWIKTRDFRGTTFSLETSLDKMRFRPVSPEEKKTFIQVNTQQEKKFKT